MSGIFTMNGLGVFAGVAALDFAWARYNIACAERRMLSSACYAAIIYFLAGVATLLFVNDPWMLAPGSAGAAVGTGLSVWSKKHGK